MIVGVPGEIEVDIIVELRHGEAGSWSGLMSAWDVFLVYPSGTRWKGSTTPVHATYMHRRGEELPRENRLNALVLRDRIKATLHGSASQGH